MFSISLDVILRLRVYFTATYCHLCKPLKFLYNGTNLPSLEET